MSGFDVASPEDVSWAKLSRRRPQEICSRSNAPHFISIMVQILTTAAAIRVES
jgi:hypothetical protein